MAQLQLEVRSLRAAVTEAESVRPHAAARALLTSMTTAAAAVLTGVLVMAFLPGTLDVLKVYEKVVELIKCPPLFQNKGKKVSQARPICCDLQRQQSPPGRGNVLPHQNGRSWSCV